MARRADNLPRGLYIFILKTDDIEAIFKTPEAAIIKRLQKHEVAPKQPDYSFQLSNGPHVQA